MTPPETAAPEIVAKKKSQRAEAEHLPLVPLSITIPRKTLNSIIAEAKGNYPITPSQIARRILVAYYDRQAALKKP